MDAFDKALADERGARIPVSTVADAQRLRARLHQARVLDRKQNRDAYPEDHPMHGHSAYDEITVRILSNRAGKTYVYLEKVKLNADEIQALSEVDEEMVPLAPPARPPLVISGPQPVAGLLENFRRRV